MGKKNRQKRKNSGAAAPRGRAARRSLDRALARHQRQDLDGALADCEAALAADPRLAAAHRLRAVLAFAAGDAAGAEAHSARAVALAPDNEDALVTRAEVQAEAGHVMPALATLERALAAAPRSVRVLNVTANIYRRCNRSVQAMQLLQRSRQLDPSNAATMMLIGDAFFGLGKVQQALASYRMALTLDPRDPGIHDRIGTALLSVREREEAELSFLRAIALKPDAVDPHVHLAAVRAGQAGSPQIEALEALKHRPALTARDGVHIRHALAKQYDDCGDVDRAIANAGEAGALRRRHAAEPFDIAGFEDHVASLRSVFTADVFAGRPAAADSTGFAPVFVVGMPRSGTTLLETIIDCHPAAHGAGELPHMGDMAGAILDRPADDWRAYLAGLPRDATTALARSYAGHLQGLAPGARRVIDKMPHNFLHLWLVAMLFPGATVVHCRRDPLDTCLSCHLANLEFTHGYRDRLDDLGRYYRQYEALMEHWSAVLPLRFLDVRYEDLVVDQEAVTRRVVDALDLAWDPACLDFHRNARAVKTVSNLQVGQRLYATSVGRWRDYAPHLGPLIDALWPDGAVPDVAADRAESGSE